MGILWKAFYFRQYGNGFYAARLLLGNSNKKPPLRAVYVSNMAFYDCSPSDNFTDVKFLQAGLTVFAFRPPNDLRLKQKHRCAFLIPTRAKQFALFASADDSNKKPPLRAVYVSNIAECLI